MKTNVSDTSIASIRELRSSGKSLVQRQKIVDCIRSNLSSMTRGEIAKATGIDKSAVAGRVNKLIKEGVVIEVYKDHCNISGVLSWRLSLSPDHV